MYSTYSYRQTPDVWVGSGQGGADLIDMEVTAANEQWQRGEAGLFSSSKGDVACWFGSQTAVFFLFQNSDIPCSEMHEVVFC